MADPAGANAFLHAGAKFTALFPSVGVAIGGLDTTGTVLIPASMDGSGQLKVAAQFTGSLSAASPANGTTGTTVPAQADYIGVNVAGNLQGVSGTTLNATTFALNVAIAAGSITASNPSVGTTGTTAPTQATLLGVEIANGTMQYLSGLSPAGAPNATTFAARFDLLSVAGTTISLGGQAAAASIPVVLATNVNVTTVISGTPSVNIASVGGVGLAFGQAVMATSIPVVIASNQSNLTTVLGAALPAGTNAIGTVSVTGAVGVQPATVPSFVTVSAASGTPSAVAIKSSTGTLKAVSLYNNNATTVRFLKIFNVTAAGVNSSVVPIWRIGIPPGAPFNIGFGDGFLGTGTGLSYWITGLVANNDTTAVATDDVVGVITYL